MKNEKLWVDKLVAFLESVGCECFTEVIPDECKDWKQSFRVDLIFKRDDFGYVACECKDLTTLRQGGKLADDFKQIQKKRNYTYFGGQKISRWCVAPNFIGYEYADKISLICFLTYFFNAFDVDFLTFEENKNHPFYSKICLSKNTFRSLFIKQ